ncbi:MAG TPA: hypothetical protein VK508_19230 [Cyclobacteriaceae bacterium]|nr:hypothetical protein [Cyclobacteriaceae bacterium]
MRRLTFLTVLLASAVSATAQDSVLTKFLNYRKEVVQEKMFLHTDRDVYLTGEIMWLKIYTVDASLHAPIDISKIAYVELVDADNQSVLKEKIALSGGIGTGSIFLPASIANGNYLLRAYTSWMKNFSADFYFKKPVSIINSFVRPDVETTGTVSVSNNDVQLFPEGGTLLAGVVNKIGVKVNDRTGLGLAFSGSLVSDGNDTVAHFHSSQFGMGSFDFTPVSGKKYRAVVHVPGSPRTIVSLADAATEGYSMRVTDNGDALTVEVSFQPSMQSGPAIFLLAHTRQQVAKAERKTVSQGKASFEIKKKDLKDGVSHITLFDNQSRPIAERLYFKQPENNVDITVESDKSEYQTRSKVALRIQTAGAVPQMSMSVYRLDSLITSPGTSHIDDFFYLTSDLNGRVESPGYYLTNTAEARAAADNLMLTQGWRRFNWTELLKSKPSFTYAPEYHGHLVRGLTKDLSGNIAPSLFAYVTVPGKIIDVNASRSNSKGEVLFELQRFIGSKKVLTVVDSLHQVELLSPFSDQPSTIKWPALKMSPSIEKNLLARSVGMQVQKIYYEDKYVAPTVDSSAFYGKADETYLLDDYTRFPVMEEVMREYVPGVFVRKQHNNFKFYLVDVVNKKPIYETPMILLDGVPVFDVNKVMAFDPLRVKKLEVVTRKFYHGIATFPGIVSYTTYRGDLGGFELDAQYVQINYEGLQLQREFYSPRHEYVNENEGRLPDQRSLLFWTGSLTTDNTGTRDQQFFTSDVEGTYQIIIEGITTKGSAGFATHTFRVKSKK